MRASEPGLTAWPPWAGGVAGHSPHPRGALLRPVTLLSPLGLPFTCQLSHPVMTRATRGGQPASSKRSGLEKGHSLPRTPGSAGLVQVGHLRSFLHPPELEGRAMSQRWLWVTVEEPALGPQPFQTPRS